MSTHYSPQQPDSKVIEQALQDKSIEFRKQSVLSWSKRIIQGVSEIIEGLTIARGSGIFFSELRIPREGKGQDSITN